MIPSELTPTDLERLAAEFCSPSGTVPTYYERVHRKDGEIAATNGRILIHIRHPLITPADGAHPPVFSLEPPSTPSLAGPEWIHGPLQSAVRPAMQAVRERLPGLQENFRLRTTSEMTRRICPCCGQEMWGDDDGDLHDPDEFLSENEPDEESTAGHILLRFASGNFASVSLYGLDLALHAANILGGATALRYDGTHLLSVEGDGWYVILSTVHRFVGDAAFDLAVPDPATP